MIEAEYSPKLMKTLGEVSLQSVFQHIIYSHFDLSKSSSNSNLKKAIPFETQFAYWKSAD